jgi:hypothetical protein
MAERDRHKGKLDPEREEFIFMTLREMIAESAPRTPKSDARPGDTEPGRFLCIPANDEADEIAAAMFGQLLASTGKPVIVFRTDARRQGVLRTIGLTENDILCVSALPPFAFAEARNMTAYLRRRFANTKIMVGVWGFSGDPERAMQRFEPARPDTLVASLASAVASIPAA